MFSVNDYLVDGISTIFRPLEQEPGTKTVIVRSLDGSFGSSSPEVSRTITVLASPFEAITANETKVRAAHMLALRTAVNTTRNYYGLPPTVWSGDIAAKRTLIRNWPFHVLEIRNAVEPVIELINQFDASSEFDVPVPDWEEIGSARPRAAVMQQLQGLILTL